MDIYKEVTDSIVKCLEKGVKPWCPAHFPQGLEAPNNPISGTRYKGINYFLLSSVAMGKGYPTSRWATKKQIEAKGGAVKVNQKPSFIVKYLQYPVKDRKDEFYLVPKSFDVYNLAQTKGLKDLKVVTRVESALKVKAPKIDRFLKNVKAEVKHSKHCATPCYRIKDDRIEMPLKTHFTTKESYYSVLLHEHVHWTGSAKRLKRARHKKFGDEIYAFEELIADLGAAFMGAELDLVVDIPNHASYLDSWLSCLRADKKAIFKAARGARKACEYMKKKQPKSRKKIG